MYKKTQTYTDFYGQVRTEDFYFNLSQAEITEMEIGTDGGYSNIIKRMVEANDIARLVKEVKNLMLISYGERSDDGRYFNKSPEISKRFENCAAFSDIYMELVTDASKASEFAKGIMPEEARRKMEEIEKGDVNASTNS